MNTLQQGSSSVPGNRVEIPVSVSRNRIELPLQAARDAYQLAKLKDPSIGTLEEWLVSLQGKQAEFQKSSTHIQWRIVGDATWIDLVPLEEIKGTTGAPGLEVELGTSATHIQWRYVGDETWTNLVALVNLKGDPGNNGTDASVTLVNVTSAVASAPDATAVADGDKALFNIGGVLKWFSWSNIVTKIKSALGSMAQQNADAVAITGGTAQLRHARIVTNDGITNPELQLSGDGVSGTLWSMFLDDVGGNGEFGMSTTDTNLASAKLVLTQSGELSTIGSMSSPVGQFTNITTALGTKANLVGGNIFTGDQALAANITVGTANTVPVYIGAASNASAYSGVWFTGSTPTTTNYAFLYGANQTLFNAVAGGLMSFRIGNTAAINVFSNGNVGVGASANNGYKLDVNGTLNASGAVTFLSTLAVTGAVTASNLSGTNTGDQDLSGLIQSSSFAASGVIYVSKTTAATDTRAGLSNYDPSKTFATITAALTAAASGDTVHVLPGVYDEILVMDTSGVTLYMSAGAEVRVTNSYDPTNFPDVAYALSVPDGVTGIKVSGDGRFVVDTEYIGSNYADTWGAVQFWGQNHTIDFTASYVRFNGGYGPYPGTRPAVYTQRGGTINIGEVRSDQYDSFLCDTLSSNPCVIRCDKAYFGSNLAEGYYMDLAVGWVDSAVGNDGMFSNFAGSADIGYYRPHASASDKTLGHINGIAGTTTSVVVRGADTGVSLPDIDGDSSRCSAVLTVGNNTSRVGKLILASYEETPVSSGTVTTTCTLSISSGTFLSVTLTASTACTFTMPAPSNGASFTLCVKQPAVTGNGSATFTGVVWSESGTPVITPTAGKMDILSFVSDGSKWFGTIAQGFTY